MKSIGKKVAYLAAACFLMMGTVSTVQATPIAFRVHGAATLDQSGPEEGPLSKAEQKALKKQERAERKAAQSAAQAEWAEKHGTSDRTIAGWRTLYIPGYGYQRVYVDAFGYPSYDILGRPLYLSGFASPYHYRPYRTPVIVRRYSPCR